MFLYGTSARVTRQLLWIIAVTTVLCTALSSKPQLRFRADGSFHIVQLADLHYGHTPEDDAHTDKVRGLRMLHNAMLVKPLGTLLFNKVSTSVRRSLRASWRWSGQTWQCCQGTWSAVSCGTANQAGLRRGTTTLHVPRSSLLPCFDAREQGMTSQCMRRWRQLTKPILAAGVPHALILGNHDDEADLIRAQIVRLDQRLKVLSPPVLNTCAGCSHGPKSQDVGMLPSLSAQCLSSSNSETLPCLFTLYRRKHTFSVSA